ncbi:DUF2493 domain-containing protein [Kitasatospora sp. NBC_00240]|uniref:DUF2493 domain-containing protein n=1 Tax=Kitasatospora sp. NBC_00240 TaxID=2903567 RepID=UPI002250C6DD|nr:DUF2493 domain-containing protein [Kitasatospora sp. NBC_00240]MCX5209745.1 DUF2493 domain-containing protein [Kitasatospora sp. NBC_00240]
MIRIIVTGSRNWTDRQAVWDALAQAADGQDWDELVLVHGACPTGADHYASRWASLVGITQETYPANWTAHGKAAGPIRNQAMVAAGADLVLAFPLGPSPGTRNCMAAARNAGIPVKEYAP